MQQCCAKPGSEPAGCFRGDAVQNVTHQETSHFVSPLPRGRVTPAPNSCRKSASDPTLGNLSPIQSIISAARVNILNQGQGLKHVMKTLTARCPAGSHPQRSRQTTSPSAFLCNADSTKHHASGPVFLLRHSHGHLPRRGPHALPGAAIARLLCRWAPPSCALPVQRGRRHLVPSPCTRRPWRGCVAACSSAWRPCGPPPPPTCSWRRRGAPWT